MLLVPLRLMKSPKYLAVVAFVPPVSLPSALDCFAATNAPLPIHIGTTTSLESSKIASDRGQCWKQGIGVFSDLFFNTEQCLFSSCYSFLFNRGLVNAVNESEESRVDLSVVVLYCLMRSVRSRLLRRNDCIVVCCAEDIASCTVSLPRPSTGSPDTPLSIAEFECQRCSAVQVFEHPTDNSRESFPEYLRDGSVLKAGESGLGISKIVGTTPFGSPAPGHAQINGQTCFFSPSALDVTKTPLRCGLIHVV